MTTFVMGRALGVLVCTHCHAAVRAIRPSPALCPRCGASIHVRKPHSVATTAALIASAALLYIPANLLPVMHTHTFFSDKDDTIVSGVLSLIQEGSWPLALLVFVASIVVPLLKLIGRWSMLDVYAISVIVALVQIRSLATIRVGLGALAFGTVVVLTMLAAQTFDERLLWDAEANG